jgi:glycine dehydrogenase subunit 1
VSKAAYAAARLTEVPGVEPLFGDAPFFKEFPIRLPRPAEEVRDALIERGYLGGVPLPDDGGHALLVAVTERRSREEIDGLAMALKEVLA